MWDVHTNEKIGFQCLARSHMALAWVPGGPIPDYFWVVWQGHPIAHTHLATVPNAVAERGFKPFVQDRHAPVIYELYLSSYQVDALFICIWLLGCFFSICPLIKQMPCLSVFGCQVAFLAFVQLSSRFLVYLYLVVRLLFLAFLQLSSRCLVYLYLLVRLVVVSICPVFKHMPCLSVFACQVGCSETLSNFQWLYLVVILVIYALFISVIHNVWFIMCKSKLCRLTTSIPV